MSVSKNNALTMLNYYILSQFATFLRKHLWIVDHWRFYALPTTLVATPPKSSPTSVHNLLRYTVKCQFTPYLLMVKNPGK